MRRVGGPEPNAAARPRSTSPFASGPKASRAGVDGSNADAARAHSPLSGRGSRAVDAASISGKTGAGATNLTTSQAFLSLKQQELRNKLGLSAADSTLGRGSPFAVAEDAASVGGASGQAARSGGSHTAGKAGSSPLRGADSGMQALLESAAALKRQEQQVRALPALWAWPRINTHRFSIRAISLAESS